MSRKRAPHNDWICDVCECPTDCPGEDAKHIGGGQNMKACRKARPILRTDHEANLAQFAKDAEAAMRGRQ